MNWHEDKIILSDRQGMAQVNAKLQGLVRDYEEKERRTQQLEAKAERDQEELRMLHDSLAKVQATSSENRARLALLEQENESLKQANAGKDRELERVREEGTRREKAIYEQFEEQRRADDERVQKVLDRKKDDQRDSTAEYASEDARRWQEQLRSARQQMQVLREGYDKQLGQASVERDQAAADLSRCLRQIQNLNLVIETKQSEILSWEDRLSALQDSHRHTIDSLRDHFQRLLKSKIEKCTKQLQLTLKKESQASESALRHELFRASEQDVFNKNIIKDRNRLIQQLQQRVAELEYLLPSLQTQNESLSLEVETLKKNWSNAEEGYQVELKLMSEKVGQCQQLAFEEGYNEGVVEAEKVNQALIEEHHSVKERLMEACERIVSLEEEHAKLNEVIGDYKGEVKEWAAQSSELSARNTQEMEKLKGEFERQQEEWLEREMYEANRRNLKEKSELEERLHERERALLGEQDKARDWEKRVATLLAEVGELRGAEVLTEQYKRDLKIKSDECDHLQQHLRSVERQRNDEFSKLMEEMRVAEQSFKRRQQAWECEYEQLEGELQQASGKKQEFEVKCACLEQQVSLLKAEIASQKQHLQEKDHELDAANNHLTMLEQDHLALEAQQRSAKQQATDSQSRYRQLQDQYDSLGLRHAALEFETASRIEELDRELNRLQQEKAAIEKASKRKQHEWEQRCEQQELIALQMQRTLDDMHIQNDQNANQMRNDKVQMDIEKKRLKEESEVMQQKHRMQCQSLQQRYSALSDQLQMERTQWCATEASLNSRIQSMQAQIQQLEDVNAQYRQQISGLQVEIQAWNQKYSQFEYEMTAQMDQLEQKNEELEGVEMSSKEWETRCLGEKENLETQITHLKQQLAESESFHEKENARLEKQSHDRLVELERCMQRVEQQKGEAQVQNELISQLGRENEEQGRRIERLEEHNARLERQLEDKNRQQGYKVSGYDEHWTKLQQDCGMSQSSIVRQSQLLSPNLDSLKTVESSKEL